MRVTASAALASYRCLQGVSVALMYVYLCIGVSVALQRPPAGIQGTFRSAMDCWRHFHGCHGQHRLHCVEIDGMCTCAVCVPTVHGAYKQQRWNAIA